MSDIVLITGGLGYIGGRVTKYLADNTDYKIRITTRQNEAQVPDWLKNGELAQVDLMSDKDIESACTGVRHIVYLAALNEIDSATNPGLALTVNGLGSLKFLQMAEKAGIERFIYFSTAHVYGSPLQGTITEKSLPRPVHPYAITHKTAEDFVLAAHDQKVLTGIVLRLSNGFGVPMRPNIDRWTLLVNDLCRQAVTTRKLVLRSAGFQKRDFITLLDVSRAVSHFLSLPVDQCDDGLFNLGGECSLRIIDLVELIAKRCYKIFGFKPEIIRPESLPHESSTMLEYSIEKLKSTGFVLNKNMNAEIDATLLFCQNEFGQKV
jgi:UDP-glucose 4-epimerase